MISYFYDLVLKILPVIFQVYLRKSDLIFSSLLTYAIIEMLFFP